MHQHVQYYVETKLLYDWLLHLKFEQHLCLFQQQHVVFRSLEATLVTVSDSVYKSHRRVRLLVLAFHKQTDALR